MWMKVKKCHKYMFVLIELSVLHCPSFVILQLKLEEKHSGVEVTAAV